MHMQTLILKSNLIVYVIECFESNYDHIEPIARIANLILEFGWLN